MDERVLANASAIDLLRGRVAKLEASGGGGSLNTATVRFVSSSNNYTVRFARMFDDYIGAYSGVVEPDTAVLAEVPLASGGYLLRFDAFSDTDQNVMPTLTGDIVLDADAGGFVITGNCTFTCAGTDE